jgi:hypothetical protein
MMIPPRHGADRGRGESDEQATGQLSGADAVRTQLGRQEALGHLGKQGSSFMRFLLVEAARRRCAAMPSCSAPIVG